MKEKKYEFEDSDLYEYFSNNQFLFIVLSENKKNDNKTNQPLKYNIFKKFKRITFSDDFINKYVKNLWKDTRDKIIKKN